MIDYKSKYLKYKMKYFNAKYHRGGMSVYNTWSSTKVAAVVNIFLEYTWMDDNNDADLARDIVEQREKNPHDELVLDLKNKYEEEDYFLKRIQEFQRILRDIKVYKTNYFGSGWFLNYEIFKNERIPIIKNVTTDSGYELQIDFELLYYIVNKFKSSNLKRNANHKWTEEFYKMKENRISEYIKPKRPWLKIYTHYYKTM